MTPPLLFDDDVFRRLSQNPVATARFPFMAQLARQVAATPAGGCGCSGGARPDYNTAKAAVAGLPAPLRTELKGLAGVTGAARVVVRRGAGQEVVDF